MSYVGMDRETGAPLSGVGHLQQSLRDLLSTPLGSRRERPEYGSLLPRMVDLPVSPGLISSAQAEAARRIARWEPRLKLKQVTVQAVIDGRINFHLSGVYLGDDVFLDFWV